MFCKSKKLLFFLAIKTNVHNFVVSIHILRICFHVISPFEKCKTSYNVYPDYLSIILLDLSLLKYE